MAFWSGQTLASRAANEDLIDPFDAGKISCSAYELTVGSEAFVTRDKTDQAAELTQGRTPGHLLVESNGSISIPSGQFAILITEERVKIPADSLGLISIKASRKWMGLVNVSGFHVDPGWNDRLIFGVFNAGPQTIVIKPKEPFFLLFFAKLDEPAKSDYLYKNGYDFSSIPSKLMQGLSAAVPTVYKLNENVKELREEAKSANNRSTVALGVAILAVTIALGTFAKALDLLPSFNRSPSQSTTALLPNDTTVSAPEKQPIEESPATGGSPQPTQDPRAVTERQSQPAQEVDARQPQPKNE